MQIFDLDGKPVKTLEELNKAVRRRVLAERPLVRFQPGKHTLITRGRGVPGKDFPNRCLVCHRLIRRGESWLSIFNGEYSVIRHDGGNCKARKLVL